MADVFIEGKIQLTLFFVILVYYLKLLQSTNHWDLFIVSEVYKATVVCPMVKLKFVIELISWIQSRNSSVHHLSSENSSQHIIL